MTIPFELKPSPINLLPIFKGSLGEDPDHKHLKDFHMVCDSMRPHDHITEEQLNLRAFPFSITDGAKR